MGDVTSPAQYGDTDATLAAKLAKAAQTYAGVTNTNEIERGEPRFGQTINSNLLRFAYAVQQL